MKKQNIAFLLGAGVSIHSGMLNTSQLTEKILLGDNVVRMPGTDGVNIRVQDPSPFTNEYNEYINRIKKLFLILRKSLGEHYSFANREINYEDYYYLIDSLHSDENMEYENPIVTFYSNYLLKEHSYLFEPLTPNFSQIRLIELMSEAKNYIKDLVAFYLNKTPNDLSQFNFLSNIEQDSNIDRVFIFTLNHDRLIEQYFNTEKIIYSSGFIPKNDSTEIWDADSFNKRFNIFKLHGSIDWFRFDSDDPYEKKMCRYLSAHRSLLHPYLMIGSFNKLSEYSRGANFDLQNLFAKYLNSCNRLIISGYSFGDQGINSRIINWLFNSREREIIVIHKNEKELFLNARPAMRSIKESYNSLIKIIPKWFQETGWAEIKSIL